MAVLTVLMVFTVTNVFAQLKEVRGVQTRVVTYQGDKQIGYKGRDGETIHGFEFKNENNYSVWVEAELCTNGYSYKDGSRSAGTYNTKSFTLNAGETYVWKTGDKMIHEEDGYYSGSYQWIRTYKDYYDQYYVKYKAYKAE